MLDAYVKNGKIIEPEDVECKTIEEIVSGDTDLEDFLRKLLTVDPLGRPTAEEALAHPWLNH